MRLFPRTPAEREAISKQRNERLTREIGEGAERAFARKLPTAEREHLAELSRKGGSALYGCRHRTGSQISTSH